MAELVPFRQGGDNGGIRINARQPRPDPERLLNQCVSREIANKDNEWPGRNVSRWSDPEAAAQKMKHD
jgi:hypothetical protein